MKKFNKFAKNLSEIIKIKGLTQKEIAKAIHVKPNTLNQWVKGKREPDIDTLLLLCYYLKVEPTEILSYNEIVQTMDSIENLIKKIEEKFEQDK